MRHDISVIIPHYDDVQNLAKCVELLDRQSLERTRFEIVIADNNSRVGLEAVRAAAGPGVRIVSAVQQGAGPARNAAVEASDGHMLAFIDSDCRPHTDWLERGIAALAETDVVGGRVDVVAEDPSHPNPIEAFEIAFAFPIRDYVERKSFAVTANMFVRRSVFDKVGPYRTMVAEDIDWCRRAVAMGYQLQYDDTVIVEHPARANWADLARKWRRTTSETHALMLERPDGRLRWLLQCLMVLGSVLPHSIALLGSPKLTNLKTRIAALGVLIRIRWFRFRSGISLLRNRKA